MLSVRNIVQFAGLLLKLFLTSFVYSIDSNFKKRSYEPSHDNNIDTHADDYNTHRAKIVVATCCWRAPSDRINKIINR